MIRYPARFILLLSLLLILAAGCNVTKNFNDGEYLLVKNKLKFVGNPFPTDELEPYLQQHPNNRFGILRTNIALYNLGSKGKDTRFKKWLRTKVGAAPVLLDTSLVSISRKHMSLYMGNKGYFNSTIRDSVALRKKKAKVYYFIHPSKPYLVSTLTYSIADPELARFVYSDTARCLVKTGKPFDSYLFDEERTRITNNLLNAGFFRFSSNYIKYTVDTNNLNRSCNVILEIINPVVPTFDGFTAVSQVPHKRYFINRILIFPEFDYLSKQIRTYDTLVRTYNSTKSHPPNSYYFLTRTPSRVKERTIAQSIFITPGSHYNLSDINQTYSQLSGLQVFKYINIQFNETEAPPDSAREDHEYIDCHIELARAPAHSFSISTDGTNSGGAFGVQANAGFQNRNIFRGAQLFRLNLTGSLQMQATDGTTSSTLFNTIEFGANASLTFPQFLLPVKPERFAKRVKPKTTITLGYNYQHQLHYDRHVSNATFGYNWLKNERLKHILNPVELSLVKIFKDSYFDSVLNSQSDNRLKNQYTDHMVAGMKYTLTFSNQQISKVKDFVYIRANFETGGNLLYVINSAFKSPSTNGYYTLFGLPYAQYVRPDIDFRFYNRYANDFSVVYRVYGGIGIPYGNATLLPFEKAFFAGGANGMRGWRMYSLGPGTYHNENDQFTYNQLGDIQLEANIEYRFPVYEWIRGALFTDMGNIWLLQESSDLPGGKFKFPDFFKQFGLDVGLGLRLDFDFFIFRLDPAIRIYDPSVPGDDRWYFRYMQLSDIVWNFGIGYPF